MNNTPPEIEIKHLEKISEILGFSFQTAEKYYPRVLEPLGKPSHLNLSPREFFYWVETGVIDAVQVEKGQRPWSRLNLYEMVWITIVKELRAFNMPFADLAYLKKAMFSSVLDTIIELKDIIPLAIKDLYPDPISQEAFTTVLNALISEEQDIRKEIRILDSQLAIIMAEILLFNSNVRLIVYRHNNEFGFTIEGLSYKIDCPLDMEKIKQGTYLTLNLRNIVAEYLMDPELEPLNEEFGFISEEEKEILALIRDKQVKEIQIKKGDNETLTYTATSRMEIRDEQAAMIKRLLRMNEFDEVRVVLRNKKHLYIENKKKTISRPVDTAQKKKRT